jgi:uncharacterized protein DUF1566
MTVPRTIVGGVAVILAIVMMWMPGGLQAQGSGASSLLTRVSALESLVQQLQQQLASETAARIAADTALQNNIDAEAATRATADTTLQGNIDALDEGLTSYDQLQGLPCTTALNTQGTAHLIGLLKRPVCAVDVSANGRFFDLGLVIVDTQTDLMWEKKKILAPIGDLHLVNNVYDWCTATGSNSLFCAGNTTTSWIDQVNAEVFAGFSDWHAPTANQLLTIVNTSVTGCGSGTPCINPIFGPTQADAYWTPDESSAGVAYVNFFDGLEYSTVNPGDAYVRAVRSLP